MVSLHIIVVAAFFLSLERDDIDEKALGIYDGLQLADTLFITFSTVNILMGNEQI